MKFLWIAALVALAASARAGDIVGTVRAAAPAGNPSSADGGDAYASRRYKFVEKIDYDHLRDFVIYVDQDVPGSATPLEEKVVTTRQIDANFDPHILPVAVGTTVKWPNEDDIYHNVYSMSDAKEFDLGNYKKEKVPKVTFDHVGRIDVFCAIHSRMHCIILVVPNKFFTMSDAHGRFALRGLPAGTYKVKAWHERLPARTLEVKVPAEGEASVDFVLSVGELPKY